MNEAAVSFQTMIDRKESIAQAAGKLLFEKKVKKLTVKDIVEECNITRQAFYYHFEDIPDLLKWSLEKNMEKMLQECFAQKDMESALHYFFMVVINVHPYVERSMQSNYGEEIENLMTQFIYRFFEQAMERTQMYQKYSPSEKKLILRYHCEAILGILRGWTKEDTEKIDEIVRMVHLLVQGEIRPY